MMVRKVRKLNSSSLHKVTLKCITRWLKLPDVITASRLCSQFVRQSCHTLVVKNVIDSQKRGNYGILRSGFRVQHGLRRRVFVELRAVPHGN